MEQEQRDSPETWRESLEELKEMIPGDCPRWTDYNLHDPGITLAELAAWLGQIKQYQLRQIGSEHKKAFLKLLGIRPHRPRPGHAFVTVGTASSFLIPAGTRFYADHIPFETREDQMVSEGIFKGFVMEDAAAKGSVQDRIVSRVLEGDWLREGKGISIQPFGPDSKVGSSLEVRLEKPLGPGVNHGLYIEFAGHGGRKPLPVEEAAYDGHGFYPLGEIKMEYLSGEGWRLLGKPIGGGSGLFGPADRTHGFIQDGSIRFSLDQPMREGRYCLRFTLMRSDYVTSPCITRISLAMVGVWQQETVEEGKLPVFTGTGFPDQSFSLEGGCSDGGFLKKGILEGGATEEAYPAQCGFSLEVQSVRPDWGQGTDEGCAMEPWMRVEDFHGSGPEDRHYCLDNGNLIFGNGIYGMAPEGLIRVRKMVLTLGSDGNIKSGTINRMDPVPGQPEQVALSHEMDVTGGTAGESPEEALSRCRLDQEESWKKPGKRAVTFRDYEQLVLSAPGLMIQSCRAYSQRPEQKEITLAARPWSDHGKAVMSPGYEKNLYRFLEEKRMVGTRLRLVSPDYLDITIVCMVCARVQYRMADRMVEEAVREWVEARELGQGILYGELLGLIDSLPCVQKAESLWLDSGSRGKRTPRGDILLPAHGLLNLKKVSCNLMTPMRERL